MTSKRNKFLLIIISIILFLIIVIKINFFNFNEYIFEKLPIKTKVIVRTIKKNKQNNQNFLKIFNNFYNDYNEKYLPETQQINLDYQVKKIIFNKNFKIEKSQLEFVPKKPDAEKTHFYTFFLDHYENNIIISDYIGNIYFIEKNKLISEKNVLKLNQIRSNLKADKILDIFIFQDDLFVSYAIRQEKSCYNWNISRAKLNIKKLDFTNLYSSSECSNQNFYQPHGGRLQHYLYENNPGLLITIGENSSNIRDVNSIIGKILFVPLNGSDVIEFSKGHRNPQGLFVEDKIILSTEHGPRGGDEINKIILNSNYGWPYASYGEPYGSKSKEPNFLKDHESHNFTEPTYTFLKAIGISEIIKLPNDFSNFWKDNFILSSLWGHSIFRIKFDKDYNKVIFNEKIYLGKRVRDILYVQDKKMIILALEEKGQIGIIRNLDE
jgi:hypothetical protein